MTKNLCQRVEHILDRVNDKRLDDIGKNGGDAQNLS